MRYIDEKCYWTYQRGVGWPNDYIGPDSMTRWIIEISVGFTDIGLLMTSESVRAYAFFILSSQASARSSIVGNTTSAVTAQSAFFNNFNNFENVVNRRVDICEDIKRYQDTLSYASSNKTNDLILNLTPENVTQHSRIVTTTRKGSSTHTKMSKIIGRQIH